MGTRGLLAFAHDGEIKGAYNHFDSYPSGLGHAVAQFVAKLPQNEIDEAGVQYADLKSKFKDLVAVSEDEKPTEDQKLALLKYFSPQVSTGSSDEWYALLRDTQGDPQAFLDAGFYIDGIGFAKDSLFCEWAYVIDLDREVVEVYKGFQNAPHASGRFAGGEGQESFGGTRYYPVKLVREVTFETLAKVPDYFEQNEDSLYEEGTEQGAIEA